MYYCTNCHRVTPERAESCPYCDKFDRLRPAEEADECRLTELDALNASVLESLLKEANVPYIARPMMGAGISAALGVTLEKFVFFVAYRDYARAQELLDRWVFGNNFHLPAITPARRSCWKPCLRRTTTRRMQTSRTRTKNRKMRTNNPHTNRGDWHCCQPPRVFWGLGQHRTIGGAPELYTISK